MEKYTGTIVEESLKDNRILNNFKIVKVSITKEENPEERWHLYKVEATEEQIKNLSKFLKSEKWYAHFWNSKRDIMAIFQDKTFRFKYCDKKSWEPAINHGLKIGIPKEQLDFLIE